MTIAENIQHIQQMINTTLQICQRSPNTVALLGVSKGQSIAAIKEAYEAGLCQFGENYWQEAQAKILSLNDLPITWHFIGAIQSNKAKEIANSFSWIHSIDRKKIAQLLSQHRLPHLPPLNICIQINLDEEETKAGLLPAELPNLANYLTTLPNLRLRGLMAIPKPCLTDTEQYASLKRLSVLLEQTNQQLNLKMDTLSMGMSDDLQAAIRAGSTLVRIGRAIFGERNR
ncbi:pyridoxal-5'-phosphate dependent enzyme family [Legionella beliardensis]|uniref:Pyridoxal phosphate homeostasis protein n=1 Tax=Legionella beliardensis TaxID=91822 RepID=A0A378I4N4_9GAMM|nr:YggS family pyridoxal phosphate-dependent enzyme [Legionella beliardensis]STX29656.1 pyridoxal-5'-phosphate dependent enzyme family [Legionella beliardensis]